jgi:hypothetical protein
MTDLKPQDHEKRFVSNDPFFMAIIALFGREPHDKVVTPTDRDEFTVTMRYSPEDSNEMPFFSDFIITNPNLPQFKTTLKDFKNEYLRFRNIILGIVAQAKKDNKIKGKMK